MSIWSWLLALHILCAVLWVGGMFFAYVIVRPSLSVLEPPQRLLLHTQVFRRFFLVVWHVMPLLLLSGFILVFGLFGGMANVPWNIQAMMGIGVLMAVIFVVLVFGPYARFRRTTDRNRMVANLDSIRKLIGINLILGLITVVLAALSQF
ncbi:MAG TPA: CopD family protein [Acetobacteraceae bacterium]|jgi:uncharacterized membrane protein|nr:CopD family protein [Acetobacteraceae bacterium]